MKHRTKLDIVHGICWLVFLSSLFTGFPGMDDYNPEYIGWVEKGPKQKINRARSQPLLKLSSLPYLIILSQVQWPLIFSHLYLYLLCLITPFGNSQWNMNRLQMIYEDLPTNKCWFSAMSKKLEGISHYAMIFPLATAHLLNSHTNLSAKHGLGPSRDWNWVGCWYNLPIGFVWKYGTPKYEAESFSLWNGHLEDVHGYTLICRHAQLNCGWFITKTRIFGR